MAYCRQCGQASGPGRKFCSTCGAAFNPESSTTRSEAPRTVVAANPELESASPRRPRRWVLIAAIAALAVAIGGATWWFTTGIDSDAGIEAGNPAGTAVAPATDSPSLAPTPDPTQSAPSIPASTSTAAPTPTATVTVTQTATATASPDGVLPKGWVTASMLTSCPNALAQLTGGTGPEMLLDDDRATGWRCDDRRDFAEGNINTVPTVGQVVLFQFASLTTLSEIDVIEGAAKDAFRWCENGRLETVQWDFGDGSPILVTVFPDRRRLPNSADLFFDIPLEPARTTMGVTMTVLSIYPPGQDCSQGPDKARPWEYGSTARPSEIRFIGRTA